MQPYACNYAYAMQETCFFPASSLSLLSLSSVYRENCKYGHAALLPETRKMSRLCFPLRKSLKIDKVTPESNVYRHGLFSFQTCRML